MTKNNKYTCECGLRIAVARRKPHERSVWHRRHDEILKMLAANLRAVEIARALDVPPSYISRYVKLAAGVTQ